MRARYHTADVFTDRLFGGNQLAVFPHGAEIPAEYFPAIARELNLSEIVFVLPPDEAGHTCRLRIFTPGSELPFAGHPTIGTACVLTAIGAVPLDDGDGRLVFEEGIGAVAVEVRQEPSGMLRAQLTAAKLPEFGPPPPPPESVARLLSIDGADLVGGELMPQGVSCGVPFLFVPVKDRRVLGRVKLDLAVWEQFFAGYWAPHVYVFCFDPERVGCHIRARMFAPAMGIPEDPATGAAASALAGYLAVRDARPSGRFVWRIEQGIEMGRPSLIEVDAEKVAGSITAVRVGGETVIVGEGELFLPDRT